MEEEALNPTKIHNGMEPVSRFSLSPNALGVSAPTVSFSILVYLNMVFSASSNVKVFYLQKSIRASIATSALSMSQDYIGKESLKL